MGFVSLRPPTSMYERQQGKRGDLVCSTASSDSNDIKKKKQQSLQKDGIEDASLSLSLVSRRVFRFLAEEGR